MRKIFILLLTTINIVSNNLKAFPVNTYETEGNKEVIIDQVHNEKYLNINGFIYKKEGKRFILTGVVLNFAWTLVKPYVRDYIESRIKSFFIEKGLKIFSSDYESTEAIKFKVIGNEDNYIISSSCEDHDGDGSGDNYLTRDFEEDDETDMLEDINYLCSNQLDYFDDYYEN